MTAARNRQDLPNLPPCVDCETAIAVSKGRLRTCWLHAAMAATDLDLFRARPQTKAEKRGSLALLQGYRP